MIITGMFFDKEIKRSVLAELLLLPHPVKPNVFSEDETKKPNKNLVSDKKKFDDFQRANDMGFFLHSESALFDISFSDDGKSSVFIEFLDGSFADLFCSRFHRFAQLGIDFGFISEDAEYEHRNRHFFTQGDNEIETWVGRNLNKYVPGYVLANLCF